jgi:hypothetical protein
MGCRAEIWTPSLPYRRPAIFTSLRCTLSELRCTLRPTLHPLSCAKEHPSDLCDKYVTLFGFYLFHIVVLVQGWILGGCVLCRFCLELNWTSFFALEMNRSVLAEFWAILSHREPTELKQTNHSRKEIFMDNPDLLLINQARQLYCYTTLPKRRNNNVHIILGGRALPHENIMPQVVSFLLG